jgi:hypothetical protein
MRTLVPFWSASVQIELNGPVQITSGFHSLFS